MKKLLKRNKSKSIDNTIEAFSCDTACTCGCTGTDKSPNDNDALDVSETKKF